MLYIIIFQSLVNYQLCLYRQKILRRKSTVCLFQRYWYLYRNSFISYHYHGISPKQYCEIMKKFKISTLADAPAVSNLWTWPLVTMRTGWKITSAVNWIQSTFCMPLKILIIMDTLYAFENLIWTTKDHHHHLNYGNYFIKWQILRQKF
jgi:hypothetical protein